jgi:DNA mismatch repair protein MutL
MPYQEVDVNVHPSKIEVRFRHPQFVHDFTRDAIRQALSLARPIPGFPAERAQSGATPSVAAAMAAAAANGGAAGGPTGPPRAVIPSALASSAATSEGFALSGAPPRPFAQRLGFEPNGVMNFSWAASATAPATEPIIEPADPAAISEAANGQAPGTMPIGGPSVAPGSLPSPEQIAELKPLGQVSSSFIVAVNGDGLWIIDQHVAHERVLFEQHLRARREGELGGQRLLVPLIAELNPRQLATFAQIAEELRANGFEAELMGGRTVAIQAAPAGIPSSDAEKLLCEILDGVVRENQSISFDSLQSKIAASTACHAAIKVNTPLDTTKMEWLLGELAKTEYPMSCPHGRPVVLRYSVREIERAFKRI